MDQFEQGKWIRTLWDPLNEQDQSPLVGERKVKVAAYCRVSTKNEVQTNSLMNQVHYYTQYIRERPHWKFAGVYVDNAVSAKDATKQQGLQRMIRHAKEKRIDFILVKNVARFSRNTESLISMIKELQKHGVGVYFEEQKLDTSVTYNEFLLSTYAALSQEVVENMSASIRWGKEKSARQGKGLFRDMFGYIRRNDNDPPYERHPEQAPIVRQIFHWYADGMSTSKIAKELTALGVETKRGGALWHSSIIINILRNTAYTGNKLFGQHQSSYFRHERPEEREKIFFTEAYPPIISMALFEEVQEKMNRNRRKQAVSPQPKGAFHERLTCHRCGYMMSSRSRAGGRFAYRCKSGELKSCKTPLYHDEALLTLMMKAFESRFNPQKQDTFKVLKTILKRTNSQDHFEFHRLQWLSDIERIRSEGSKKELVNINQAYKQFERHIQQIEEDRSIRTDTLAWLEGLSSLEECLEQMTLGRLRAWMLRATIHSNKQFEVVWVDGQVTTIGGALPRITKPKKTPTKLEGKEVITPAFTDLIKAEEREETDMKAAVKREVEVIEPRKGRQIVDWIGQMTWKANPGMMPSKERVLTAAYCRVSTDREDQMGSLEQQVAFYTYSIMKDPACEFAGIFVDEGISGTSTHNRSGLKRLIQACEEGRVQKIICKSVSRLSRNIVDVLEVTRHLSTLPTPVYIYFEREGIHTGTKDADLMLSIFGGIAQEESKNIGQTIAWGVRSNAKRGIIRRPGVNYGYTKDKQHRWHVVDEEAEVVRRIYQDVLNGHSTKAVAVQLSKEGVLSPSGKPLWYTNTIERIVRSVLYRGDYLFQQYMTVHTDKKRLVQNDGALPKYFLENHHKPIIDNLTWGNVQQELKRRDEQYAARQEEEPDIDEKRNPAFIDKLYCATCGTHMIRKRHHYYNGTEKYHRHSWGCIRNIRKHEFVHSVCKVQAKRQAYFEEHFLAFLDHFIPRLSTYQERAKGWLAKLDLSEEERAEEEQLAKQIDQYNQMLYQTVDEELKKNGRDAEKVEWITSTLKRFYDRQQAFDDRRIQLAAEQDFLKKLMKRLNAFERLKDEPFPVELFRDLVEKAVVYEDGRIHYHLHFEIEWTIDKTYQAYLDRSHQNVLRRNEKHREAIRQSEGVKELLHYCKTPRTIDEIVSFMESRHRMSKPWFMRTIFRPFEEKRMMERFRTKEPGKPFRYRTIAEIEDSN